MMTDKNPENDDTLRRNGSQPAPADQGTDKNLPGRDQAEDDIEELEGFDDSVTE